MPENAFVVVFPSVFSRNKLTELVSNIKKILKLRGQEFKLIKRDDDVIIVEANDPVFASSIINNLFGIKQIAIARQVKNEFNSIVSEIVKLGGNLLLKGEKFFVKVEGKASGFLPSDIEMAVTSSIIENKTKLGATPGSEEKHDKLLYTYLTKNYAYICIFTDKGRGGIPQGSQNKRAICAVYDELSALSCLEILKQGFDIKILVCYRKKSDLLNIAKMINQLLQAMLETKVKLEIFHIEINSKGIKNYLYYLNSITDLLCYIAKKNKISWVSLAISPLIFPNRFLEDSMKQVSKNNMVPILPLSGLDENIFQSAKEIGLSKYLKKMEKFGEMNFPNVAIKNNSKFLQKTLNTKKDVLVKLGPNNLHEIIDSLELDH